MAFISISFIIFFLPLVIVYHLTAYLSTKNKDKYLLFQNSLLLIASLIFYAFADLRFLPFLIYVIIVTFLSESFCKNKISLIIFLILDLLPLLSVKYIPHILRTQWIFPLGISFFTFQSISYIVDSYKNKIPAEHKFLNTALFIAFFPTVSSGPIQRAEKLIPQFKSIRKFDYEDATDGMKLFAWGMFKKLCIADRIAVYVNYVYDNVSEQSGLAVLFAVVLYSFQIYCDFSAYTDMAVGVARYLGFDIGKNFDHPYLSKSTGEFWRRWHISLSSWLRDYVYIPLGGSRVAIPRIYLNLMITFLISGIWHGSTWNYVIWGILHGLYLCVGRTTKSLWEKIRIPSFIRIFVTFCLVTFAWIFFHAENIESVGILINKMLMVPHNVSDFLVMRNTLGIKETILKVFVLNKTGGLQAMILLCLMLLVFFICELITYNKNGILLVKRMPVILRWLLYTLLVVTIMCIGNFGLAANFIYNNF